MEILKTQPLSLDEFLELRQWCNANNIAYKNDIVRRDRNEILLFINDQELKIFAQLKWVAQLYPLRDQYQ
jgi:hypothetical protein